MNLDDVAVFLSVARERGFTRAARVLDVPKSTVSERIARLEKSLGVRLFDRTTRSLGLTDSGAEYLERVRPLVEGLVEANAALTTAHRAPRGLLRVGAPLLVAQSFLASMVCDFLVLYPDIAVEFVLQENPSAFDLAHDRLDLAIHVFGHLDPSLVARRLGTSERLCVASPAYLAERGAPTTPAELRSHACVVVGALRKVRWVFSRTGSLDPDREVAETMEVAVTGRHAVTSIDLVHRAIVRGIGIGVLPTLVCADSLQAGSLVRVLPEWSLAEAVIQVVYPSGTRLPARTRAFADLLIERSVEAFGSMPRYDDEMMAAKRRRPRR